MKQQRHLSEEQSEAPPGTVIRIKSAWGFKPVNGPPQEVKTTSPTRIK
jgi:hypothetical protein